MFSLSRLLKRLLLNQAFSAGWTGVCVLVIFWAAEQISAIINVFVSWFGRLFGASHPTHSPLYQISFLSPALFQLYLSVYWYTRKLYLFCHHFVASRHAGIWFVVLGPLGQILLPWSWPKIGKAVLLNIPKACCITFLLLLHKTWLFVTDPLLPVSEALDSASDVVEL